MNRRDFLKGSSEKTPPARLTIVSTAGSPKQYRAGTCILVAATRAWLLRDATGFYAIDAFCPHLGCLIHPQAEGWVCPGHGSQFTPSGERTDGCKALSLRYLYVDLDAAGDLIIRRDRSAHPNDRLMA